ncbi:polysaccharide deacetylase family protein [Archangium primigenium]|uniref:polysaccharide deacetylase family protein n=1 Tax=[Archangium] primigenium TaxID=2792470 RepID=UPI00195EE1DF|nr:polysaccharide deacetylase family protein [Archangium primigenium]MBM7115882.1 polysaccharide deacetylase family protein [Archangium primigenium]
MDMRGVVRRAMKSAAAGVLHHSGLRKALASYRRHQSGGRRVLIVSYHRVVEDFFGELQRSIPGLLISQETFRRHLEGLSAAGYKFATIGEALDVMSGAKTAHDDLCVVTFDDGYRDVYRYAYPVLKEMGVPAITYLPSNLIGTDFRFNHDRLFHLVHQVQAQGFQPMFDVLEEPAASLMTEVMSGRKRLSAALDDFIGHHSSATLVDTIHALEARLGPDVPKLPEQGDLMNWDEVREMARDGFEFGAHTLGHVVLTHEPLDVVEREVRESKAIIERELGTPVRDFAYCNGWYSDDVIDVLMRNGFRSAVTTEDMSNRIGGNPFTLKRKVLWENFSVGVTGSYSPSLTVCQLDDCFGTLGMREPVLGRRPQRTEKDKDALSPPPSPIIQEGVAW